jgi:hypothetical protein
MAGRLHAVAACSHRRHCPGSLMLRLVIRVALFMSVVLLPGCLVVTCSVP